MREAVPLLVQNCPRSSQVADGKKQKGKYQTIKIPTKMFSYDICVSFKNIFFYRTPSMAASGL